MSHLIIMRMYYIKQKQGKVLSAFKYLKFWRFWMGSEKWTTVARKIIYTDESMTIDTLKKQYRIKTLQAS